MAILQDHLYELVKHCHDLAAKSLGNLGDFQPFGLVLESTGAIQVFCTPQASDHEGAADASEFLAGAFAALASQGAIVAVAIASNDYVPEEFDSPFPDALCIHLEAPGYSRRMYFPYTIDSFDEFPSQVMFFEPVSVRSEPNVFPCTEA